MFATDAIFEDISDSLNFIIAKHIEIKQTINIYCFENSFSYLVSSTEMGMFYLQRLCIFFGRYIVFFLAAT